MNGQLPKISIVTPSFNQGEYIEDTINSVLNQNYPNLEYIIIDGGSTDNTVDIIRKYEKHLKYWISEPDKGQSDAINKGLAYCTGEIFNWLNSDDLLETDSLHSIVNHFSSDKYDIVSGWEILFNNQGGEFLKKGTLIYPTFEKTLFSGVIYQPSTFWKLSVIKKLFPINNELHFLMDADLWLRYLLQYGQDRVKKVEDILARFRLHDSSKTMSQADEFIKQRWMLRRNMMSSFNLYSDQFMDNLFGNFNYSSPILPYEIKQSINTNLLFDMIKHDLVKYSYKNKDYEHCNRIMSDMSIKYFWQSSAYRKYWFRLNLIPRLLLKKIRK